MSDKIVVSVIGAGGKMGTRTSNNLLKAKDKFDVYLVENSPKAQEGIRARGLEVTPGDEIIPRSDIIVFAVPDTLIYKISQDVVKKLKPGAGFIILDPAAAVAKELALRDDCTFAVAHPCHPSYFLDQDTYEARHDYFGGVAGKQDVVISRIQGDDKVFDQCRQVIESMYAPVEHSYVLSSRQIAFLEPTLVELLGATCLFAMAETVNEAEKRGIERAAAVSFLTGHVFNLTANFLGFLGNTPVSDACKVAINLGNKLVLRDDWKEIWKDEVLDKVIATMLHPEDPKI
ncbi:oxidoreductase [Betaproteobacteria bacterium]|nr:oxidoreductase [Betaproteobacteria bacterium]